jgi:hypothetical protein
MAVSVGSDEFLSAVPRLVATFTDSELPTVRDKDQAEAFRHAWQHLIDYRLIEWGSNPTQFDDEGVEPPSRETITHAIKLAQRFQAQGFPAPDSVVPDANGGIVFERREKDVTEVLHVWSDGGAEYHHFHGTRLVERTPL